LRIAPFGRIGGGVVDGHLQGRFGQTGEEKAAVRLFERSGIDSTKSYLAGQTWHRPLRRRAVGNAVSRRPVDRWHGSAAGRTVDPPALIIGDADQHP
jgi:hypothetical protein